MMQEYEWQANWVSVYEQLPRVEKGENSVNVIVCMDKEIFETTYNKELGWCYPDSDDPYPKGCMPSHWIDLPILPKEQQQ
jgi:hypothetical protein